MSGTSGADVVYIARSRREECIHYLYYLPRLIVSRRINPNSMVRNLIRTNKKSIRPVTRSSK